MRAVYDSDSGSSPPVPFYTLTEVQFYEIFSSFLVLNGQNVEFSRARGPDRRVFSCSNARSLNFLVFEGQIVGFSRAGVAFGRFWRAPAFIWLGRGVTGSDELRGGQPKPAQISPNQPKTRPNLPRQASGPHNPKNFKKLGRSEMAKT